MIKQVLLLCVLLVVVAVPVAAKDKDAQEVQVADPYIELHTGPGSSYPIFYVVERGEWVSVLKRKTQWFKIKAENQPAGWVHRDQLEKTLTADKEQVRFTDLTQDDYELRRWDLGVTYGRFDGAPSLGLLMVYPLAPKLGAELSLSQAIGDFSSSLIVNANVISYGERLWRVRPFFTLGSGWLKTEPKATLVQPKDSDDFTMHVGAGFQAHLDRQFMLRVDYKNYVVFSSDDNNEDPEEWKIGFVVFFK